MNIQKLYVTIRGYQIPPYLDLTRPRVSNQQLSSIREINIHQIERIKTIANNLI